MTRQVGLFRLGEAIRSWFAPRRPAAKQDDSPRSGRKRLWALVQTKPVAVALLVSDSLENLEAEARELNETWNHRDLRKERHAYEIQPVALLQTGRDPVAGPVGGPRQPGQQHVGNPPNAT